MTATASTIAPRATTRDEERVFIPCDEFELSAVLTKPTAAPNGIGIVFYAGRWSVTSVGRSGLFVHLARELAAFGYHSLRLDYFGLGESTGQEQQWCLEAPFQEEPDAAVRWLGARATSGVIVIGTCGGARLGLDSTRRIGQVRGLVMFSPPVRDYQKGDRTASLPTSQFVRRAVNRKVLRGLTDPRRRRRYVHHVRSKARRLGRGGNGGDQTRGFDWTSRSFLDPLEDLVRRQVPVLLYFGEDDAAFDDFQRGRDGRLGQLLRHAGDLVTVVVGPGRFHGMTQADVHEEGLRAITEWLPVIPSDAGSGTAP